MIKKIYLEQDAYVRTTYRLAHEIIEQNTPLANIILVGILKKGYPLAKQLQANILQFSGENVACYPLAIHSFRDDEKKDLTQKTPPFLVNQKTILLVDDVLFTGRSVRAAIDAIMAMGRPQAIRLVTMVDRGHRELPIKPDFVGKNIPSSLTQRVVVDPIAMTIHLVQD
jgi:pyrimidine operon attenuation protein/uracil phosphoribosyltransferase